MTIKEKLENLALFAQGMRVLYVESEMVMREETQKILSSIFPFVQTAFNGEEGLNLYQKNHFDLVITDVLLPVMNGINLIKQIKQLNESQSVIIMSATKDSHYLLELINLGVCGFIVKPMKIEQIVQSMCDVVQKIYYAKQIQELNSNMTHELAHKSTLLEQYKEIVDISMIVSKTDNKGKLTYVNEAFCSVSGYREEELIGKNHNIVRHPDVSSDLFRKLWETIKSKQVWHGIVKNRKKDGTTYITDATIKPILDKNGNILEYISIRYDVTELYNLNEEIWHTQHEMLYLLGEVGESRSKETGNHVRRVAKYSKLLARLYGLEEEEINLLYSASPMHDIGKIGISDSILLKPARLDDEEFEAMKTHSMIGYEILKNSKRPLLQTAAIIAYQHHEKWDGTGYPRGLQGEDIHIYGRITAIADVFDALGSDRIYKEAWELEEILELFRQETGKHFDPVLIELFFENLPKFIDIRNTLKDIT